MMKRKKASRILLTALVGLSAFLPAAGCGRPPLTAVNQGDGTQAGGPAPDGSGLGGDPGAWTPGDENGDGASDLPQQPLDTPEPLPAPKKPVKKGEPMIAKAVSYTTAFALPQISNVLQINGVYIYIHLTWQPVIEAAEYWVYRDQLPHFEEARRETAYAVVRAGQSLSGFKDGLEPPNLSGGNLWDKIKRGFKMISLQPGIKRQYKVIAVDANGIPINESNLAHSTPLPAIGSAQLLPIPEAELKTTNPLFSWKEAGVNTASVSGYNNYNTQYNGYNNNYNSYDTQYNGYNNNYNSYDTQYNSYNNNYNSYDTQYNSYNNNYNSYDTQYNSYGNNKGDGYYVSVFPSVDFRTGQMLNSGPAFWSTFRPLNQKSARYGNDSANQTSYPGTLPFNVVFNLQPALHYSWTVITVKTNNPGDMARATAISRAWSGFGHFQIHPEAKPPMGGSSLKAAVSSFFKRETPRPAPRF